MRAIEDDHDVHLALAELGHILDAPNFEEGGLRAAAEGTDIARDLRTGLTQLGPARLLRLCRWIGTEGGPDRAGVLHLLLDGQHPNAQALRAALDVLNKRELLARIFDEDRLKELLAATTTAIEGANG